MVSTTLIQNSNCSTRQGREKTDNGERADRARSGSREGRGGGGTDGAAAVAEADAEGREQDGAQELQAPATAPHLVPLFLLRPAGW
jgi:hypothetical protein